MFEEKMCHKQICDAYLCKYKHSFESFVRLRKLRQSHIVLPSTSILWFEVVMQKIWTNFNKFFQEVGEKLCYKHIFGEKKRTILWSYVQLKKLKKSNIILPITRIFWFEVVIQKIQKNPSNQLDKNILNLCGLHISLWWNLASPSTFADWPNFRVLKLPLYFIANGKVTI